MKEGTEQSAQQIDLLQKDDGTSFDVIDRSCQYSKELDKDQGSKDKSEENFSRSENAEQHELIEQVEIQAKTMSIYSKDNSNIEGIANQSQIDEPRASYNYDSQVQD